MCFSDVRAGAFTGHAHSHVYRRVYSIGECRGTCTDMRAGMRMDVVRQAPLRPARTALDVAIHQQRLRAVRAACVALCVCASCVLAHIVLAHIVLAYIVLAYIVMACIVMVYRVMAYLFMAHMIMAYIVMAYIVRAYIVMACILMAYIVMDYIFMAYLDQRRLSSRSWRMLFSLRCLRGSLCAWHVIPCHATWPRATYACARVRKHGLCCCVLRAVSLHVARACR